jgi:Phosphomannomutase
MEPDGDFPTVASPNPENKEGFNIAIEMAGKSGVDLIIGTDPDGDRCGTVVRNGDDYETLSGNQMGVLLLDYLITAKREQGILAQNSAAVKSIVSTTMANKVCEQNNIKLFETLTGFKFIGEKIKEFEATGEYTFLFGFEESYGYLSGTYARDKDAVVASMLIAEMACRYKMNGMNLYEAMQELYKKYGFFSEEVISYTIEGFDGPQKMAGIMSGLRSDPPESIGGMKVNRIRDYDNRTVTDVRTGAVSETGLPGSNVLFYELDDGCSAIVRPSGTEPKIKLYVMAKADDRQSVEQRVDSIVADGSEMLKA